MWDLDSLRAQLSAKEAEKQGYLDTAANIKAVYDRMKEDKDVIKGYKDSLKTFIEENYESFKGDLHVNTYQAQGNVLIDSYKQVISDIDTNLDRLNTARCEYENKAYRCDPIIGELRAMINTIVTSIQNQFN